MGKNKLRKFSAFSALPHVIECPYTLLQQNLFEFRGKWNSHFFKNDHPIILELGCGKGEYTVGMAQQFPDKNFIGVDIKGARMWSGAQESHDAGMKNVAFIRTNIELITSFFTEQEVAEIWITFPDPQMQKYTKRLTATPFIKRYQTILQSGGLLHLKTDSTFLYDYTLEMIRENQLTIINHTNNLYEHGSVDPILGIKTYYEQQWIARGMTIKYIQFLLDNHQALRESEKEIEHDPYRSFNRENAQKL